MRPREGRYHRYCFFSPSNRPSVRCPFPPITLALPILSSSFLAFSPHPPPPKLTLASKLPRRRWTTPAPPTIREERK